MGSSRRAFGGAIALVIVAAKVGHSGGDFVYRYGAANAYTEAGAKSASAAAAEEAPAVPMVPVAADGRARAW